MLCIVLGKDVEAESSEKIRRALSHKVRSYADVVFVNGEKVYYRRKNFKGWKGPAAVLGQEGQFVLIRHGGAFYRVHPCQLMKKNKNENDMKSRSIENMQLMKMNKNENGMKNKSIKNMQLYDRQKLIDEDLEESGNNFSDSEELENVNNEGVIETEKVNSHDRIVSSNESLKDSSVKPSRNTYVKYKLNDDDWA